MKKISKKFFWILIGSLAYLTAPIFALLYCYAGSSPMWGTLTVIAALVLIGFLVVLVILFCFKGAAPQSLFLHYIYLGFSVLLTGAGVGLCLVGRDPRTQRNDQHPEDSFLWLLIALFVCAIVELFALYIEVCGKPDESGLWFKKITGYPICGVVFFALVIVANYLPWHPGLLNSVFLNTVLMLLSATYFVEVWKTGYCAMQGDEDSGEVGKTDEMVRKLDQKVNALSNIEEERHKAETKLRNKLSKALKEN